MCLPHPALDVIGRARKDQDPSARLDNLLLAFELILRVDVLVHAARFLRTGCRDDKVRGLLLKSKFNLGDWHALLQALVTVMKDDQTHEFNRWFGGIEQRCEDLTFLECRESPLQTLLRLRNRRAHELSRMSPEFIDACFPVAQCCVERLLDGHPPLGCFEIGVDGRLFYRTGKKADFPCWPFLLPGTVDGRSDGLLIYSGKSTKVFEYDSPRGGPYSSSEIHDEVIGLLKDRHAPQERIASTANPFVLRERLYETSQEAVSQKRQMGHYRPVCFLHRPESDAVFDAFVRGDALVLVVEGPAGTGKTSWFCDRAERRIAKECAVLLAPIDRLPGVNFPEVLGDFARVQGEIGTALERLSGASKDHRVVILIDDLGAAGREQEAFARILNWVGTMPPGSPVRIAVTIRSEQLRVLRLRGGIVWNPAKVLDYRLPPFRSDELFALAGKLPVEGSIDPEALRRRREDMALRLGILHDSYVRRPGLATSILGLTSEPVLIATSEEQGEDASPSVSAFSIDSVYSEIVRRDVLSSSPDGLPRTPLRLGLLKGIAKVMLERACTDLPIDCLAEVSDQVIEKGTGRRTADYEALLSSQILIEKLDDFEPRITFAHRLFFEYIAALSFSANKGLDDSIRGLCERSRSFPPTLVVATFLSIRAAAKAGAQKTWEAIFALTDWRFRVLREMAPLDGGTLLKLLGHAALQCPTEVAELVTWLIDSGEPRLGSLAAQVLYEKASVVAVQKEACFQRARALYEMDDYPEVVEQLKQVTQHRPFDVRILLGDVAASKGDWETGRVCYQAAFEQASEPLQRAHALRGVGFVLGKLTKLDEAEQCLKESLALLAANPGSRVEAEAWSDLGEVLLEKEDVAGAKACLERSLEINKRNGCLVGIGIVEGLLGALDMIAGDLNRAEECLNSALEIARLTENRYRQAFVLARLSQLKMKKGEIQSAEALKVESARIYGEIAGTET